MSKIRNPYQVSEHAAEEDDLRYELCEDVDWLAEVPVNDENVEKVTINNEIYNTCGSGTRGRSRTSCG